MSPENGPASLVVTRIVGPRHEGDLRAWAERVARDAAEAPGFLAALRLEQTGGLFHYVYRFGAPGDLAAWEASERCRGLMREADGFSTPRRQRVRGADPTVRLPAEADSPKWKRFLMTYAAVLPIVVTVNAILNSFADPLPPLVQSVVSSLILVAAMTWAVLPFVSRRLKPWVVRDAKGEARLGE